ncbi:hypothetical protein [Salinirussus salinus]|jgi:hypothetical protein|uniref:hypothetical protein n=1 Tax=Salinirussus salinus TaxID=1198300 RepID=UPI00135CEBB7|nr:hypothetical protein [Salinirussus salinus]
MAGNHDPLSVTVEDGEVVLSVFNIDTYDSARVRLDPEEAQSRAREVLEAVDGLLEGREGDGEGADLDAETSEAGSEDRDHRSQMGIPPGAPSATPFRA